MGCIIKCFDMNYGRLFGLVMSMHGNKLNVLLSWAQDGIWMELKWRIKWHWNQFSIRAWKTICRPLIHAHTNTHPLTPTHPLTHSHTITHKRTHSNFWLSRDWTFSWTSKTLVVKSRLITFNEEFWTLEGSNGLPRLDQNVDGSDRVIFKSLVYYLSLIVSQIQSDLRNPNFQFFFVRSKMLKMKILSTNATTTSWPFMVLKTFSSDVGWRIKIRKNHHCWLFAFQSKTWPHGHKKERKKKTLSWCWVSSVINVQIRVVVQCNQMAFWVGNKMRKRDLFFCLRPSAKDQGITWVVVLLALVVHLLVQFLI